ncbi:hypothetical protein COO60DRAFT_1642091 [Scenedesmus sp. NREL 46B-D3]|nr:hypothetical protein COO60DRAFT_1642091 [Scenedesmus sp. NREL 46B-D3]
MQDRCYAAHTLASLLEAEEAKYKALVGDPHSSPSLRNHYTIGKLLNAIKDEEELFDAIVDQWLSARSATLEQQVAGLRLLLACLDCWLFQYPLTEEALVEKLGHWAVGGLDKAAVLGDEPPGTLQALQEEARQTYAMGLLAIALANEEYGDEAVQTPMVSACCSYMQRAIMKHRPAAAEAQAAGGSTAVAAGTSSCAPANAADGQQQQQEAGSSLPPMLVAAASAQPEGFPDDVQQLRLKRLLGVVRCLTCTGEYVEALAPYLGHQGVECCCVLLQTWRGDGVLLNEVLQMVCSLLAHRRFGELLVELGGVQLLLACPRTPHSSMGLSLALFGLASLPLAFERTCALPQPVPSQLVSAALSLLAASSDAARKNAALFFDSAVHYPVLLEGFDAAEGLHRLLFPLRHVSQLLQAGHVAELRAEKQVAYHASRALLQYVRAHLVLHMASLQRRLRDAQGAPLAPQQPHKPLNTSAAAVDELIAALSTDPKLAEAFVRTRWPLLDYLSEQNLVPLILELVRAAPAEERYFSDICLYCLEVLQLITLSPLPRRAIYGSGGGPAPRSGSHPHSQQLRSGMAILLHAASTATTACGPAAAAAADKPLEAHQTPQPGGPPTQADAAAPPALELGPSAVQASRGWPSLGEALEASYAAARQAVRASNGIRVLLMLLQSRQHLAPAAADRVRALSCSAVLGLARDSSIRHILTKLQVGKLLAELVREPVAAGAAGGSSSRREDTSGPESSAPGITAVQAIAETAAAAAAAAATLKDRMR